MGALMILNIILIILLIFLIIYIYRNKKYEVKCVSKNSIMSNNINVNKEVNKIEKNNRNKKIEETERVFEGRFVDDEEYQQIMKNRKSDISILLKELDNEYEHLKELIDERE
jgi:hypothetical protein